MNRAASLTSCDLPAHALTTTLTVEPPPPPTHHCSCGRGFIKLVGLEEHLDRYADDTDAHVQMALKRPELLAYGLRRVRRELGLTMRDMAGRLGMDVSTISRIEADRRGGSRSPMVREARVGIIAPMIAGRAAADMPGTAREQAVGRHAPGNATSS